VIPWPAIDAFFVATNADAIFGLVILAVYIYLCVNEKMAGRRGR
jgi:hypothetical protein